MSELMRLNLSDDEIKSVAREYTVLPTGSYVCNIVEIKEETVKPSAGSDNVGKPYWNVKFVVAMREGEDERQNPYGGKPIFTNLMLWQGAAFQLVQLIRATFPDLISGNDVSIPKPESLCGKQVLVIGKKLAAGSEIRKKGKPTGQKRESDEFRVTGFMEVKAAGKPAGPQTLLS